MKEEEIIKKIDENVDNRIMFTIRNGYKKLREEKVEFGGDITKRVILLDNVPLISLSEEKTPMCLSIIRIEKGRDKVSNEIKKVININKSIRTLEDGFETIKPILKLLEDGDYELEEHDMIPTDGESNYFWNSAINGQYYEASADNYYRGNLIKGFAKFLVPSEDPICIDMDKVNYYRDKIRCGEDLIGIALELKGFMALLIDGHHKATAAYLEGKTFRCFIIKNVKKSLQISNVTKEKFEEFNNKAKSKRIPIEAPKEAFPDFRAIAVVRRPIDISRKRIDNLLKFNSRQPIEELMEILYYLSIYKKEKAKDLCFEILDKNDLQIMWGMCLEYLSRYNDGNVKKVFEKILLDKNIENSFNYRNNLNIIINYFGKAVN